MSMTFENATTKSVDVNGTNFVFREIGKKGGVPVVFLHHLTAVYPSVSSASTLAPSPPVLRE
jgi:hypothetical protein